MGAIRVLVVDDHEMVADGLVGALKAEPDVDVVGTAGLCRMPRRWPLVWLRT